jgi:MFS transporter, DHA1 family, multidrug resistance protein
VLTQTELSAARRLEILIILGALAAFAPLSIDMYLPSMPQLEVVFHASSGQVQWSLAAFFLGFAVGQTTYGPFTDRFGRKAPLYFGMSLYVLSSLGCALAPSIWLLSFFRLTQAFGACSGAVISRAVVRDLFPPEQTRRVFATLLLVNGLAPMIAPLIGSYLLLWFGWRSIFFALGTGGLLCLLGVRLRMPETLAAPQPLSLGHTFSTYKGLLSDRLFLGAALAVGFSTMGLFAYIAGAPFVLMNLYHLLPQSFGWIFSLNAFGVIIGSQTTGRLLHGVSPEKTMLGAAVVQLACGVALVAVSVTGTGGLFAICLPLFAYLTCVGFVFPSAVALALGHHGRVAGMASALLGTMQFGLAGLSTLGLGTLPITTAMPMAAFILAAGVMGVAVNLFVIGRQPRLVAA